MLPLGLFAWFGHRLPLRERLTLIAETGFDAVSLWLGEEEELVAQGRAERLPALALELGLTVDHAHAPFPECNRLWSKDAGLVAAWTEEHARHLTFCHEHAIPRLVIHVVEEPCPPAFAQSGVDAVRRLATRAEQLGVVLAIENTCSAQGLGLLLESIPSPALGLCYDSSHDFLPGQTRGEVLATWGARLAAMHLSDNHGEDDDHFLPGDGQVDWQALATVFPRASYSGTLVFELLPRVQDEGTAGDFVRAAYGRALRVREVVAGNGRPPPSGVRQPSSLRSAKGS
ncbi:MAG: sugar phosphate isomerase/epimerase [Candidatus Riflebacteria bacterium]|nr:sugar phosphate isomerase/epimerase [Candidatus Riflebacteria bacterium]